MSYASNNVHHVGYHRRPIPSYTAVSDTSTPYWIANGKEGIQATDGFWLVVVGRVKEPPCFIFFPKLKWQAP